MLANKGIIDLSKTQLIGEHIMRNYTDTMTEITWSELKKAMNEAATSYRHNPKARISDLWHWHGDEGLIRAENIERLTANSYHISNDDLFILLSAVFKSSNALALRIAEKLFDGEYTTSSNILGHYYETGRIGSAVFSTSFLAELKNRSFAFKKISDGETSMDNIFDKFSATKGTIEFLTQKCIHEPVYDARYDTRLQNMITSLKTKQSHEMEMLTVPMLGQ